MCSIAGIISLDGQMYNSIEKALNVMNHLQQHRGPDGDGVWFHNTKTVGLAHRRLSIIDLEI